MLLAEIILSGLASTALLTGAPLHELGVRVEQEVTSQAPAPYRVGRIEFVGNTRTRESVLRTALGLAEGEIFNLSKVESSIARLQRLVELDDQSVQTTPDPQARTIDLRIAVEERDVFYPEAGGGYSETDGWSGRASLRMQNALGFGEAFSLQLRGGELDEAVRAAAAIPSLFAQPVDLSVQVFDEQLSFLFDDGEALRQQRGFSLQLLWRLGENVQLATGYSGIEVEDRSQSRQPFPPFGSEFERSSLGLRLTWDSQDDLFDPRSGQRLRIGVNASGGALGGDVESLLPTAEVVLTRTLRERSRFALVFRGRLAAGWIEPLEDIAPGVPAIPTLDRFFVGGDGSVRGFARRSIWLRDPDTGLTLRDANGDVRGGDGRLGLNLELHLIPRGPVRVVLFADAANLIDRERDFELDGTRSSAGVELQLRLPRVPIPLRLIWAENLDPLEGLPVGDRERFDEISFGFGVSF